MFWHMHLKYPIFFLLLSLPAVGSMPHTLENKGHISNNIPPSLLHKNTSQGLFTILKIFGLAVTRL